MYKADLRSDETGQKEVHLQGVYANAHSQGKRRKELDLCSWSPNYIITGITVVGQLTWLQGCDGWIHNIQYKETGKTTGVSPFK